MATIHNTSASHQPFLVTNALPSLTALTDDDDDDDDEWWMTNDEWWMMNDDADTNDECFPQQDTTKPVLLQDITALPTIDNNDTDTNNNNPPISHTTDKIRTVHIP